MLCIIIAPALSQYEGLDTTRRQSKVKEPEYDDPYSDKRLIFESDKLYGIDFWAFNSSFNFLGAADVNPYAGLNFNDKIYTCIGLTGSYYNTNYVLSNKHTLTTGGINVFVRLRLESLFIHGEYRWQNSYTYSSLDKRQWYGVPIIGVGYSYSGGTDLSSYVLLGLGLNPNFGYSNPNGLFIYKIGLMF